jgi:hypothetical protein
MMKYFCRLALAQHLSVLQANACAKSKVSCSAYSTNLHLQADNVSNVVYVQA